MIDPPAGNSIVITYPDDGSYSWKTETRGAYSKTHDYDGFGRLIGTNDSLGRSTTTSYSAYGSKLYDDSNIGDKIEYDLFGRIKRATHKDGNFVDYSYVQNTMQKTDEAQKVWQYTYASFGSPDEKFLVKVQEPGITTPTTYKYNILGSLCTITQGDKVVTYEYDSKNFLEREDSPETGEIIYERYPNGLLWTKTDSMGTAEYIYDEADRLDWISAGSLTLDFEYDNVDNLTAMNSPDARVTFVYDAANRQEEKNETILGKDYKTSYEYDGNGNIESITYPTGLFVDHEINQSKNQITDIVGYVSGIQYNIAGQPRSYLYANGVQNTLTYNDRFFNDRITAAGLMDWEYVPDSRGNTREINDLLDPSGPRNQSFTYDDVGRLEDFNGHWDWGEFSYYDNGDRKTKTIKTSTNTYNYDSGTKRLLSITGGSEGSTYSYNADGSVKTGSWVDENYQFTYDGFRNLSEIKKEGGSLSRYGYDANGMRVVKSVDNKTTVYHYDQNGNTLSETTPTGEKIADYIYLNGKLVAKVSAGDTDGDGVADYLDANPYDSTAWKEGTFLYYPHVDSSGGWETEIALINTGNAQLQGTLYAYNSSGNVVETKSISLPANGRKSIIVGTEFTNYSSISHIKFAASSSTCNGYEKFYQSGTVRAAIPAVSNINSDDLYVTHIDSSTDWWTAIALLNTTNIAKTVTFTFSDNSQHSLTLGANEHWAGTVGTSFPGLNTSDTTSAIISGTQGVIALELFGGNLTDRASAILLSSKASTVLHYPHIASDQDWWTGIVAYNPSTTATTATLNAYGSSGTLLNSQSITIGPKERFISAVSTLSLNTETAWIKIESAKPIAGLQLVGGTNEQYVAANSVVGNATSEGIFPKLEDDGWTGIAFVNTASSSALISLTAINDNGDIIATSTATLAAHEKIVSIANSLFLSDISSATYIKYSSNRNLVGFQLNGSSDGMFLDCLPGLMSLE